MDKKCIDCPNPVHPNEADLKFFEELAEKFAKQGRDFTMPKRCKACRDAKKARIEGRR